MLKYFYTLCFISLINLAGHAQQGDSSVINTAADTTDAYYFEMPEREAIPVGGMQTLYQTIAMNINYPMKAIKKGTQGTSMVRFVIDEEGNVNQAEIVEGHELGDGIDEEAIRIVKLTKWVPAMQDGQPVKQRKIMPLKFRLPDETGKRKKKG